ncbi:hypothetical protein, partial [Streptomyces sp. NPDC056549]|uniref:hypothetical protein n=1 Tax=Streptomyces sp. NPDC056549 TaxID=3345864 RepID=UPI00369291ED
MATQDLQQSEEEPYNREKWGWSTLRRQRQLLLSSRFARRLIRRDLGLMGANDMSDVLRAIKAKRGKEIVITRVPLPPEVSAFCVRGRDRDFIVVDSQSGELTQAHATLHELFHIWDEEPKEDSHHDLTLNEETLKFLLPGLKAEAALKILKRSHYARKHERNAEV